MVNEIILVGKLAKEPVLSQTSAGHKICNIVLEIVRHHKNMYGLYEYDYLEVTIWRGMAQTVCNTCKVGSVIAVKGRIQPRSFLDETNKHFNSLEIIAEKVSILDAYVKKDVTY